MALYFLRTSKDQRGASKGDIPLRSLTWLSYLGALLILITASIQAVGLDRFSLSAARSLLPKGFLPPPPKVVLFALDRDTEGFDPLELAMTLRGLAKLNPSQVIINGKIHLKSDSLTMLEGVHERLIHAGIRLVEGSPATSESLWKPVSLSTYTPPPTLHLDSPLPLIAGKSLPEGKTSFLPPTEDKATSAIPLLATTDAGEIAGSIWWDAIKSQRTTGTTWLLAGKLILFPHHAPLLISSGGARTHATTTTTMVPMDLFLLRIEEKERGTISPDFESLWDHATVVIGSTDDILITGTLHSILRNISFHRLPILLQALLTLVLIAMLFAARRLPRVHRMWIGTAILVITIVGGVFALNYALLLPSLAPLITAIILLSGALAAPILSRR